MTTVAEHVHNAFLCPFHVRGCDCEDLHNTICNPYRMVGYCPDNIDQMPEQRVIVRYETANSVYDVDHTGPGYRVRRVEGVNAPTRRQGRDGEWKDAVFVTRTHDARLLFRWSGALLDGTITSPVKSARPLEV